jgi:hypothetical protein
VVLSDVTAANRPGPERAIFFGIEVDLVAPFFAAATWIRVDDLLNNPELAEATGRDDTVIVARVEGRRT